MAAPKKPLSTIDQIVAVLKDMVSEPMSDLSSLAPRATDVRRVRTEMGSPAPRKKKAAPKARARPAAKKKRPAIRKKGAAKRAPAKKAKSKKRSKKR